MYGRKPGEPGLLRDGGDGRAFKGQSAGVTEIIRWPYPTAGKRPDLPGKLSR